MKNTNLSGLIPILLELSKLELYLSLSLSPPILPHTLYNRKRLFDREE